MFTYVKDNVIERDLLLQDPWGPLLVTVEEMHWDVT